MPVTSAKRIRVQFHASVSDVLPWKFTPQQREVRVLPGETALAFYTATNRSDSDIIGVATYSVVPAQVAPYFSKIQCFCFEEQRLSAGETVDMPVFFYLDPDMLKDVNMKGIDTVTLNYTFFSKHSGVGLALHRVDSLELVLIDAATWADPLCRSEIRPQRSILLAIVRQVIDSASLDSSTVFCSSAAILTRPHIYFLLAVLKTYIHLMSTKSHRPHREAYDHTLDLTVHSSRDHTKLNPHQTPMQNILSPSNLQQPTTTTDDNQRQSSPNSRLHAAHFSHNEVQQEYVTVLFCPSEWSCPHSPC